MVQQNSFLLLLILISGLTITSQDKTNNDGDVPVWHEIDFKLEAGRLYTVPISHKGPKLLIGVNVLKKMDNIDEDTVLECKAQSNEHNYRDLFRTKLSLQLGEKDKDFVELQNKTFYSEYFTITRQEVWTCATQLPSGERVGVIRVKNELVGTGSAEIMQLSFRDGVIVTPRLSTFNTRTAAIREIKFLDPLNGMPVEYVGKVTFPEASSSSPKFKDEDFIGEFYRTLHEVGPKTAGDGSFREMNYDGNFETDGRSKSVNGGVGGIKLGSNSGAVYGITSDIHNCRRFQGLNPLPFKFRTQCTIEIKWGDEKLLDETTYFDEITPISHQVWYCEHQSDQEKYFFRVVNEFVTRRAPGKVVYWNDVVQIKEIRMPIGLSRALRVKAIKYFNPTFNPIQYVGRIKFLEQDVNDLHLFTNYDSNLNVIRTREIEYMLDKGRAYRTVVGSGGLNIKVNSKWVNEIGKNTDLVICKLQAQNNASTYAPDYGTKVRVLIWINNREESHAVPRSLQKQYWHVVAQELWICSPQDKQYKFIRVVNKLEGLKAIYEIEYYEGVELHRRYIGNNRQSVTIIETKYLNPITLEILKFEGELQLKDRTKKNSIGCVQCSGLRIRAGDDEIVLENRPGQTNVGSSYIFGPVKFAGLNPRAPYSQPHSVASPFVTFRFKFDPTNRIGNGGDIVDCYMNDAFHEQFYPAMEFFHASAGANWKQVKMKDEQTLKYLTFESMDAFVCSRVLSETLSLEGLSVTNGYKFYMVYTDITVAGNSNIYAGYGVQVTRFPDKRRVQLTQFFDYDNQNILKFEGKMRIHATNDDSNIMSGTVDLQNEFQVMKRRSEFSGGGQELEYKLMYERNYRMQVDGSGSEILNLGTSSSSATDVDVVDKIPKCRRDFTISESEFRTEYRTKCYTDLNNGANIFDEHFKMYHWEVWNCYLPGEPEPRFKRVVNHFTLQTLPNEKSRIKGIQYYDGMSVEVGTNVYGLTGWDFTEIKYTSPLEGKIYTYRGKLQLESEDSILTGGEVYPKSESSHSCLMDVYGHSMQYLLVNQIYRKFFSWDGSLMRIGSQYEKEFKEANKLRCQELSNVGQAYSTRVYLMSNFPGNTYFSEFKEIEADKFKEYFEIHSTRVWECKPAEPVKDENFKLLRVENWLKIMKLPASYYFYDGVIMDKSAVVGSLIGEIKYIDPRDNKLTKYEGFIRFEPSILNYLQFFSNTLKVSQREVYYPLEIEVLHIKYLNKDGITLHIGARPTSVFGKRSDNVVCRLSPYNSKNNKFTGVLENYYPVILSNLQTTGLAAVVKPLYSDFLKQKFELKSRQYWKCSLNSTIAFFKIVNSFETVLPLSAVIYHDGITVWTRHTTDGKKLTIFKDVHYIDYVNQKKFYRFEGRVINIKPVKRMNYAQLLSTTSVEATQAPTSEQFVKHWKKMDWYKRYQIWEKTAKYVEKEPLQNIIYMDLSPSKSVVSFSNGYNIRVGSHWEYEIGSSRDTFECEVCDANKYKKADLLTKLVISLQDDDELETNEESIEEYFTVKNQEVSTCAKKGDKSISFLRVVTELEGRVGVGNIEYYDGVEFIAVPSGLNGGNTANIVEHKYLHPTTFKVIKFAGMLVKKSADAGGWMYSIRVPVPVYHGPRPDEPNRRMTTMVDPDIK